MPEPGDSESREDFVSRCIPIVLEDGSAEDQDQAVAMCNSIWKQESKAMAEPHDVLLDCIRSRSSKRTEFNYGILTADRYVKTFQDMIGMKSCRKYMCQVGGGSINFEDLMKEAANTLTYSHPDMEVKAKQRQVELPIGVEAPKNTLMVFRHILTTSKKDRDGDILRTGGAIVDPKMLLLWQHVHTLPIGKFLAPANHTKDELQLYSCIVDVNEVCNDAAVMIDNDMGRFSHGFRALDFTEIKAGREGGEDVPGGYDVKRFEILEESLVSIPANPDAETQEIIVSLVEGGKLTSGLMKECAQGIRKRMPLSIPVEVDLKVMVNGQEVKDANESRDEEGRREGNETGASEKAGKVSSEEKEKEGTGSEEVKKSKQEIFKDGIFPDVIAEQESKALADDSESGGTESAPPKVEDEDGKNMVCPDCDYKGSGKEGKCPECGAKLIPRKSHALEKAGRVLSKANEGKIKEAIEDMAEVAKMEISRSAKALLNQAKRGLGDVITSLGVEEGVAKESNGKIGVKRAMAVILTEGSKTDLDTLRSLLGAFEKCEKAESMVEQFYEFVGQ